MARAYRDSALVLEFIKPILKHTKEAYVHTKHENEALRLSNQALRAKNDVQEITIDQLQKSKDKGKSVSRWVGRLEGTGIGFAIGVIVASLIL